MTSLCIRINKNEHNSFMDQYTSHPIQFSQAITLNALVFGQEMMVLHMRTGNYVHAHWKLGQIVMVKKGSDLPTDRHHWLLIAHVQALSCIWSRD